MTEVAPPPLFRARSSAPKAPTPLPALATLPVSSAQCEKAINALLAHVEKTSADKEANELLGAMEEKVFVVVGLKEAGRREVHMPVRFDLPHPVLDPRQSPVTLFVKDPQREYKDLLDTQKIGFISRVVGLDKLRNKHKTFEAKRLLLKESEMFLVDDRVLVEVGKALGKLWRDARKQPIPVSISKNPKSLKASLESAISASYLQLGTGTSLSIKIGSLPLHNSSTLLSNLLALLPQLTTKLPHSSSTDPSFNNIQSIHLKTSTSIALPIFNAGLEEVVKGRQVTEGEVKEMEKREEEKVAKRKEREEREREREEKRLQRSRERLELMGKKKGEGKKRKAVEVEKDVVEEEEAEKEEEKEVEKEVVQEEEKTVKKAKKVKAKK